MAENSHKPFRLGDWLVEPDMNRISNGETERHLEPMAMAVLVFLCERPLQVVSADDIIAEVWGGRPMGDNPLYKSVAKLRRALGDDLNQPRFIATVSKKGYRLVATVIRDNGDAAAPGTPASGGFGLHRAWPMLVGLIAGVVIATAVFWQPQSLPPSIHTMSTFPGSHSQPSFAPDGESFAFVSDADGAPHIWILESTDDTARQLTRGDASDARPRWSPDGTAILFTRDNSLWSIPVSGGEAAEIVRNGYNANWSHDGERIVFERRHQVWTADAGGGEQQRIGSVPRRELPLAPRWPAFSPDGSHIVYFHSDDTPLGDLWITPVDGGDAEQLTFSPALGGAPVWSPNGEHVFYSSRRGGYQTLWKVNVADKTSEALLIGSGDDDFPDVSADGSHLIYSNSRERYAVVLSDPVSGTERNLHESRLMLIAPELSPDRNTLVYFGAARTGGIQIFTLPMNGEAPRMLTSDSRATHAIPRWAADGSSVYFYHTLKDTSYSKVGVDGGEVETVVAGWNWNVANGASIDPGQTRVVYSRLTGQVPVQTLIRDLTTGDDTTFYATLEYPRWSRDGSHITGSLHVDQRFPGDIAICPVAGAECRILAKDARIPVWSPDESRLYFVRGFGTSQDLFVVPVDGSAAETKLMSMAPLFPLGPFYQVTDDGSIVWVRYEKEPGEIWVMDLPEG